MENEKVLKDTLTEANVKVESLEANISQVEADKVNLMSELKEKCEKIEVLEAEMAKANDLLKMSPHADLGSGVEPVAVAMHGGTEQETILDKWQSVKDNPKEASTFWQKNKNAILACIQKSK